MLNEICLLESVFVGICCHQLKGTTRLFYLQQGIMGASSGAYHFGEKVGGMFIEADDALPQLVSP